VRRRAGQRRIGLPEAAGCKLNFSKIGRGVRSGDRIRVPAVVRQRAS